MSLVDAFIEQGFVRIDAAFSRKVADAVVSVIRRECRVPFDDPTAWSEPVVRLGDFSLEPFVAAANTPTLAAAFDALVGATKWLPRRSIGSFPVRFPTAKPPSDDGWHIDASFPGDKPDDFLAWRVNAASRGRALTMLFLFTDVGEGDAPTRLKPGSHKDVARLLAPHGDRGLAFMEIAQSLEPVLQRPTAFATGPAGTVYLCHPFLVHAAQAHRGRAPKVMAQPPLFPAGPYPYSAPAEDSVVMSSVR